MSVATKTQMLAICAHKKATNLPVRRASVNAETAFRSFKDGPRFPVMSVAEENSETEEINILGTVQC